MSNMLQQRVCVLGSTGSIGVNTLDVIARHPETLSIYALSAHSRIEQLAAQASATGVRVVIVPDEAARKRFLHAWPAGQHPVPEIRIGQQALCDTVAEAEVTTVMAAIVGAAGLPSALAAAAAGKRVLLANKEALVAAGSLFMRTVRDCGAELLPIDSEHNAIFQCMPQSGRATAPTQPARGVGAVDLLQRRDLLPARLAPGRPDVEEHDVAAQLLERDGMVEYEDGSILAQLGQPDMRTPIAYGLGFPERIDSGVGLLALTALGRLDFEEPNFDRFPCLRLSFDALATGQAACVALNAANEIAVDCFLNSRIRYTEIAGVIEACLDRITGMPSTGLDSLDDVLALDARSRRIAAELCLQKA